MPPLKTKKCYCWFLGHHVAAATHAKSSCSIWGGPEHVSRRTPIALPLLSILSSLSSSADGSVLFYCSHPSWSVGLQVQCPGEGMAMHLVPACPQPLHPQPWPAGPFYHDWGLEAICWGLQVLKATRKCSCERWRGCQWAWHPTGAWGLFVSGKAWDDLPFAAAEGKSRTPGSGMTTGCVLAPCPGANWPCSQRKEEKFPVSQQGLGPGHLLAAGTCDRAVPHVHTWDTRGLRSLPSLPSPLSCYPSMLPQCLAKHVCTSAPLLAGDVSPGMVCIVPPWCATGTVSPHLCQQQRHAQKAVDIYASNQLFFLFIRWMITFFSWGIL